MDMSKQRLDSLVETLLRVKNKEQMRNLLLGIFTPGELEEIPRRLEIVRRLKAGIGQHRIARDLGVGVATVTRGSREIQKGRFKYV